MRRLNAREIERFQRIERAPFQMPLSRRYHGHPTSEQRLASIIASGGAQRGRTGGGSAHVDLGRGIASVGGVCI